MYQAQVISKNIVRLGGRSYNQRMKITEPGGVNQARLSRLNTDLDIFYDLLYDHWREIDSENYTIIESQLSILLDTLGDLIDAYSRIRDHESLKKEVERLGMNYSALRELRNDIVSFNINIENDQELKELLNKASLALTCLEE